MSLVAWFVYQLSDTFCTPNSPLLPTTGPAHLLLIPALHNAHPLNQTCTPQPVPVSEPLLLQRPSLWQGLALPVFLCQQSGSVSLFMSSSVMGISASMTKGKSSTEAPSRYKSCVFTKGKYMSPLASVISLGASAVSASACSGGTTVAYCFASGSIWLHSDTPSTSKLAGGFSLASSSRSLL